MAKRKFLAGLRTPDVTVGSHTTLKIWRDTNDALILAIVQDNGMLAAQSKEVVVQHPSTGWPTEKVYQAVLALADTIDNEHRAHPEITDFIPGQAHHQYQ